MSNLSIRLHSIGDLIDNRADAPICVMMDKEREKNTNLRHAVKKFFGGLCHVKYVYKITPC